MDTPILILTWNRPRFFGALVRKISALKPTRIFIWCDGPRKGRLDDEVAIDEIRRLLHEAIDWECDVKCNFQDDNLGCEKSVSSGITWFFSHVECGIILEDDCLPSDSFFSYCASLLEKYRLDTRVWTISGFTPGTKKRGGADSYLFTKYFQSWGWATWKDRWAYYHFHDLYWKRLASNANWLDLFECKKEARHWESLYKRLYTQNKPDSWAFRWLLVCICNNGLSILPRINLVENIGFGSAGTHTKGWSELQRRAGNMKELHHPPMIYCCRPNDKELFTRIYDSSIRARVARKLRVLWGSMLRPLS